jgi:hypothetical protein
VGNLMDRLARDWTAPPSDALAEAVVLHGLLYAPAQIARWDVLPLLVFPEHRLLLHALKEAYAATRGQSWGHFYIRWMDECEHVAPGRGRALEKLLEGVGEDHSEWQYRQARAAPFNGILAHEHDWIWWLERLKACAEARRLVSVAQAMAERAWSVDVQGAQRVALQARPRQAVVRVDIEP